MKSFICKLIIPMLAFIISLFIMCLSLQSIINIYNQEQLNKFIANCDFYHGLIVQDKAGYVHCILKE